MSINQVITIMNGEQHRILNDYKVIEVNVASPAESLYAVCTPVRIKEQGKLWER